MIGMWELTFQKPLVMGNNRDGAEADEFKEVEKDGGSASSSSTSSLTLVAWPPLVDIALWVYQQHQGFEIFENVKAQFLLNFDQIHINEVITGRRLPKYSMKNIDIRYLPKIKEIWAKNVNGGSVKVEIFGSDKWDHCQKKTSK